jgi:hypothetical protein
MASRILWMAVGAGASVWAMGKVKDKARKYTPEGLTDNVTGIGDAIRYFADEVRAGMAERESEIYREIGADVLGAQQPQPHVPQLITHNGTTYAALPASRTDEPTYDRKDRR